MDRIQLEQNRRERLKQFDRYQPLQLRIPGLLGNGDGSTVRVPGFELTHAYVRIGSDGEQQVDRVLNLRAPFIYDMPVFVGYDPIQPGIYQVLTQRQSEYIDTEQGHYPNVGEHALSHSWAGTGYDLVWVWWNQIADLMVYPSDTWELTLYEGPMPRSAGWVWIASQTIDLGPGGLNLVPAVGGRVVLIYIDADGIIQAKSSGIVPTASLDITLTPAPNYDEFPVASVRLYAGQAQISFDYSTQDIIQVRWPQYNMAGQNQEARNNRKLIEMRW